MGTDGERRVWERLPLAIPVFMRGIDKSGKEFLDVTVALNVSRGGALVVSRHPLGRSSKLSLQIPRSPVTKSPLPEPAGPFKARVVRTHNREIYNLYALRFSRPLI
jgi:hypothetical protein